MTCIVGLVDKDKVWMGGDSAASAGSSILIHKNTKVFKVDNLLIGCSGSIRANQLVKYSLTLPKFKTKDISKYLCTDFAMAIKSLIKDGMSDLESSKFGSFLIGYKNRLFEFDDDLQLLESINGISSIGSGSDIALGSLFSTIGADPEKRLLMALKASAYYNTTVAAPFHVIST